MAKDERVITFRLDRKIADKAMEKCKEVATPLAMVFRHAALAWINSSAILPTFSLGDSVYSSDVMNKVGSGKKGSGPSATTITFCPDNVLCRPIGEINFLTDIKHEGGDIVVDDAGNYFWIRPDDISEEMVPIDWEGSKKKQFLGKPKWWKEKRL